MHMDENKPSIKFTTRDGSITLDLSKIVVVAWRRDAGFTTYPRTQFELDYQSLSKMECSDGGDGRLYGQDAIDLLKCYDLYQEKRLTL
jgi:hypothetical protein